MRVIFVALKLNFEDGGGSSRELDMKMRALVEWGHQVSVITLFSAFNKISSPLPYTVQAESLSSANLFFIQREVSRLLRHYQNQADVFHVEGQFGYGSGWYRRQGGQTRILVHFNRELAFFPESTRKNAPASPASLKRKIRYGLERMVGPSLLNYNDALTFTSPRLLEAYARFGLAADKSFVIPDFFDSAPIADAVNFAQIVAARATTPLRWTLLCGGRLIFEKGFDIVLRALAALPSVAPYQLLITGDGPERANLEGLSRTLGLGDKVRFTGWMGVTELAELFRRADIYVVPRWRPELTSMLVLEAMAFAVPYIVTANTALAWQAQGSALTFTDENYEELARQIVRLMSEPEKRVEIIIEGRKRLAGLDYHKIVPLLEECLAHLHTKAAVR